MTRSLRDRAVRLLFPPRRLPPSGPPARILILRPDHLGDLLFATPALARLRAAFPSAHITGLVGPWSRAVWERQAALDAIETLPFPGIVARPERPWQPYTLLRAEARRLRAGRYDLAIILRFDYWWGALLAEQAGIPARWGYDLPASAPFLTDAVAHVGGRHEVEQNITLAEAVVAVTAPLELPGEQPDRADGSPPLNFPLTGDERAWACAVLPKAEPSPTIAIHPGTNGSLKLWTLDGWAAVATWLAERGCRAVFTGTAAERPLADAILSRLAPPARAASLNLVGQTTLGQLAALFAACGPVLGVDSGPLHIATAVGAPTLRLYGPSDERIWGPWGTAARNVVVRAPGTQPGHFLDPGRHELEGGPEMQAITPEQVLAALAGLLGEADRPPC
ncbi:MAG: glycosyltransferase family 9 protein [Chloroflexia bacterium]